MATKKSSSKRTTSKTRRSPAKNVPMKSFKVAPEPVPFTTFKITKQTWFWSLILLVLIISQMWILNVQFQIADSVNKLEMQTIDQL